MSGGPEVPTGQGLGHLKEDFPSGPCRGTELLMGWTLAWRKEKICRQVKCDCCLELNLPISELRLYMSRDLRTFMI